MQTINIHEAKTNLSRLIERVENGEEVVISRAGTPVATLSAFSPKKRNKIAPPGSLKHLDHWMADDFNDPIDHLFDALKDE
jgi:prevent-host-death family protein